MNHTFINKIPCMSVTLAKNNETGNDLSVATRPLAWSLTQEDAILKAVWPLVEVLERRLDDEPRIDLFDTGIPWSEIYTLFQNDHSVRKYAETMVKRGTVITEDGFCNYWVYRDKYVDRAVYRTAIWVDSIQESGWGTVMLRGEVIAIKAGMPAGAKFSPLAIRPAAFPDLLDSNDVDYDLAKASPRTIITLRSTRPADRASVRIGETVDGCLKQVHAQVQCSLLPMWLQRAIFAGANVTLRVFETSQGNVILPVELPDVFVWDRYSNLEV